MKWFLISIFILPVHCTGQLKLAKIFSHNMVLQRNQPIHFWGTAIPGKTISVAFANEKKKVVVKADSSWSLYFKKQNASVLPRQVTISSEAEKIVLENILIGDIWICAGQSNMEWEMQKEMHWETEKYLTNQPLIRFANPAPAGRNVYAVAFTDSINHRLTKDSFYLWNSWMVCDSNSIKTMSAVAYYFAKSITNKTGVPIGLINLSIGGAPIETFISREALQHSKQFYKKVQGDWLTNNSLPVWVRERGKQNAGNNTNGLKDDLGLNHAYKPGFAYEAGIKPLLPLSVKGLIWYQGESNAQEIDRVNEYAALSKLMIDDYRKQSIQPALPFYFVQLSSIDTIKYKGQLWPQFRDEQRKMMDIIPHSGMAVCSDIGAKDDVHPTNKKTVGERLARWALNKTYQQNIIPSGPLPISARYQNGKIIIRFQYVAKGLQTADGNVVRGFSLDGKTELKAFVENNKIIIPSKERSSVVYYAWKPFTDANLCNAVLLPVPTFRLKVH